MYLDNFYKLLSISPEFSEERKQALVEIENREGVKIPGSIKELHTLENIESLLKDLFGSDDPLKANEWSKTYENWYGGPSRNFLKDGLIYIASENQGVCNWVSPINACEDPVVLVEVDTAPNEIWQEFSSSFSKYIYCLAFDNFGRDYSGNCFYEIFNPIGSEGIVKLVNSFHREPSTFHWPAKTTYRFSREKIKIVIWNSVEQADWAIICESKSELESVKSELETLLVWTG